MVIICPSRNRKKYIISIRAALCVIISMVYAYMQGQTNDSIVDYSIFGGRVGGSIDPSDYVAPEEHWIEDSCGIICVKFYSDKNEFRYGPHATHIKRMKWKVNLGSCDSTTFVRDERYCEGYWFGRFRKTKASQWVKDHFHCDYEYADRSRKGLIWTVKIYSKSGDLLEVHKRVLIGYYNKIIDFP